MKKIFTALLLFCCCFMLGFNASALEKTFFDDNPEEHYNSHQLNEYSYGFNVVKGISNIAGFLDSVEYLLDLKDELPALGSKTLTISTIFRCEETGEEIELQIILDYFESRLDSYSFEIYGDIIYVVENITTGGNITASIECHLPDYCGDLGDIFIISEEDFALVGVEASEETKKQIYYNALAPIYGIKYVKNAKYLGELVCLFTSYDDPYTIEEIKSIVNVSDLSGDTDFEIYNNGYRLDDNGKVKIGTYYLDIFAWDEHKNTTIQTLIVYVVDATNPVISSKTIEIPYNKILSDAEILAEAKKICSDNYLLDAVTIDSSSYKEKYNECGTFEVSVSAVDSWGNKAEAPIYIEVYDNIAPVIVARNTTVNYPYEALSDEQIKNLIKATDEYCGVVANENITINDLDDYRNNYNKLGDYRIELSASDTYSNTSSTIITISVKDEDYPEIDLGDYKIIVPSGIRFTKAQLIEYFKQSVPIPVEGEMELSSLYFDDENPTGEYELSIKLSDGSVYKTTISVSNEIPKDNIINNTPTPIDIIPIVMISIGGILLIAIALLGIIAHRKRH